MKYELELIKAVDELMVDELVLIVGEGFKYWGQFAYKQEEYRLMAFWEFGSEMEVCYKTSGYGKEWKVYRLKQLN